MWGYIIFGLVFLALGILIAVYTRWITELFYDINKDISKGLEKSSRIPHITDILAPNFMKGKGFILYARIFGIVWAIFSALGLYVVISNSIP